MLARMPWTPELFSAQALQQVLDRKRQDELRSVPFFDGLLSGELDALVESFSGVPEVHHPVRGRVRGDTAFRGLVTEMTAQLRERNVEVEDVDVVLTDSRGVEEVVLHLDGDDGRRVALPVALAGDRDADGRVL